MSAVEAKRTLVKSPPEVWAKVSDPEVLADHLADLGPVRITHVEPESVVLWEGDRTSGAVHLEAGGWGTKVRLTAELEAEAEPEATVAEPEATVAEPEGAVEEPEAAEAEPRAAVAEPEPESEPVAWNVPDVVAAPEPEPPAEPAAVVTEPPAAPAEGPPPRQGFFARWFRRRQPAAVEPEPAREAPAAVEAEPPAAVEPEPPAAVEAEPPAAVELEPPAAVEAEPEPEPEPVAVAEPEPVAVAGPEPHPAPTDHLDPQAALAVLEAALDRLGAAHHRPFSRG